MLCKSLQAVQYFLFDCPLYAPLRVECICLFQQGCTVADFSPERTSMHVVFLLGFPNEPQCMWCFYQDFLIRTVLLSEAYRLTELA